MEKTVQIKNKSIILALGAESAGNFSVFRNGKIYFSENLGDLLIEENLIVYKKTVLNYLKRSKIRPNIILTDFHPLFHTTLWGEELAKFYKAKHIQVQHHHAHIFSAIGDRMIQDTSYKIQNTNYTITLDGTGYGLDEKIWGGEVFKVKSQKLKVTSIERIGHLENQILIGTELAIQEPARMLVAILYRVFTISPSLVIGRGCPDVIIGTGEGKSELQQKTHIYSLIKNYYSKNEFELIFSQLQQNFNCLETSSAGRILDAVSLLLGFCKNERKYKHEPVSLLEASSSKPYSDIKPQLETIENAQISNFQFPISKQIQNPKIPNKLYILSTTHLFKYLIKNLHKDKGRLAATAQLYLAQGLYKIIDNDIRNTCLTDRRAKHKIPNTFIAGGLANNKIISNYLISKGAYASNSIPRGDAGISFGQIFYYLLKK